MSQSPISETRPFEEISRSLVAKVDVSISKDTSISELANGSVNLARLILNRDRNNEKEVEELFTAAWFIKKVSVQDRVMVDDTHSNVVETLSRRFRGLVIGDGIENSCAKILITLLSAGVNPSSRSWEALLKHLGFHDSEASTPGFRDASLPLSRDKWEALFSTELADALEEKQHRYCPVDLESNYVAVLEELQDIFNNESGSAKLRSLFKCQVMDREGNKLPPNSTDGFCPEGVVQKIIVKREHLLRTLYIEALKARASKECPDDMRSRREFLQKAQRQAETFFEGVKARSKILATLIIIGVSAQSTTWSKYADACLKDSPASSGSSTGLLDQNLPLDHGAVQQLLGPEYSNAFFVKQFRYCAVRFEREKQVDFNWEERLQRLPFLERQEIGHGSFGGVFRVKVKAGYYHDTEDRDLAVKIMKTTENNTGEWGSARWIFQQPMDSKNIMRALASLKTQDQIYILFPLATCSLREYMREYRDHCHPSGPINFEERRRNLNIFIGIADALKYLHCDLLNKDERTQIVCIHEDLKAENILVSFEDGEPVYRITDFGISSIKHATIDSDAWTTVNRNGFFHKGPRSLRKLPTPGGQGDGCPNQAPEAVHEGNVNASIDIWAFGTVFAEYVAWLSGGARALHDFEVARGGCSEDEAGIDYYLSYETSQINAGEEGRPVLKRSIETWFSNLIAATNDENDKRLYRSSWSLLKHGLLVCDPDKRAKIEEVREFLNYIFNSVEDIDVLSIVNKRLRDEAGDDDQSPDRSINASDSPNDSGVELLSDSGDNNKPEQAMNQNRDGMSPLLTALKAEDEHRALELLQNGASTNTEDRTGNNVLHYAARIPSLILFRLLLDRDPSLVNKPNHEGQTALHRCALQDHDVAPEQMELLIGCGPTGGADPKLKDTGDRTPLYWVTMEIPNPGRTRKVQLLLDNGALVKGQKLPHEATRYSLVRKALDAK